MGNEQSVPTPAVEDNAKSQDPAVVAGDPTRDPLNDVTEPANVSALAIETDNVKFHDGLPTPTATFDNPPAQVAPEPSTAPIGIPRQNADARDKRPAFLRRLTTMPSAVLTAQTHAENVTATPTSPSPEKTLKSVAKEQLNTVSSPRSRSATNPSVTDNESCFPSPERDSEPKAASTTVTCPPEPDNKELAQSLSSLQSEERSRFEGARWDAPRSGSVSPLSCDHVSNGAPELQDQDRNDTQSHIMGGIPTPPRETTFDGTRPVAFSMDDWAWRMEFLPSEASDDENDIDPGFFPLPDGDDESFADDELSFLDPGRESALRGESRNEDHTLDLALVRTASSAESTQKAPSLVRSEARADAGVGDNVANQQANATTGEPETEAMKHEEELAPEESEEDVVEPKAVEEKSTVEELTETDIVENLDVREQVPRNGKQNKNEQTAEHEQTCPEVTNQQEASFVRYPPDSTPLDTSPQPSQKVVEPDNRRDSAMYQLSLESPRDMDQLQTIKEPEPADQRKRMSLASIEDLAAELSLAEFEASESKLEPKSSDLQDVELSKGKEPAESVTSDLAAESIPRQLENDGSIVESQPAEANPAEEVPQESSQSEVAETVPVAPTFESPPKRDHVAAANKRPATAHPSRIAADTSSRPLSAPSNPLQVSEGAPAREKSKSWKTWPALVNRAARSKSEASRTEKDPDEILPATPILSKNAESTQQEQTKGTEQSKAEVADDLSKPNRTSGLVSKIPTPAEQSKTKEKKKRGSILGSIFRHSSTKDEKSKIKENAKLEKAKEKEAKLGKKNSKITKVYRRSSKRQMDGGEEEQKEPPTPSLRPVTAMAILDTQMVDEPLPLEQPNKVKELKETEGVLKDATEEQKTESAGKGKYGLPSASLGIPTLLQSPSKKKQNHAEAAWYHRRSAPPQAHTSNDAQLPRRASMGIFGGSDSTEGRKSQGSNLPQARPAQPQNRRASVHVPQHLPLRANPLLPPVDDSPYARATTGIPQPSTSKIFSYPNRNPPYRGVARTNSSPIQGMSSMARPQPQTQAPRAGPSRIPSPNPSQVPAGRRHMAPRLPSQQRLVDVRRSNTFSASSQAGLGLVPETNQSTPEISNARENYGAANHEAPLKGTGVAISVPPPASAGIFANSAKGEQSFVAELADTDVGRRGSEDITMRATSYPGMEWVPEDME
ncbi:uncharacterized protein IWZ02DRAFT_464309 [Phyllosticta citriasiana]|uniref:uncharacterized protein n=1 Tax=Phyllosticta citriasiana TaxID=595635 RepID=UPI0030FDA5E5